MITGFDVKHAMNGSFGISKTIEPETASPPLVTRTVARIRAGAVAIYTRSPEVHA